MPKPHILRWKDVREKPFDSAYNMSVLHDLWEAGFELRKITGYGEMKYPETYTGDTETSLASLKKALKE